MKRKGEEVKRKEEEGRKKGGGKKKDERVATETSLPPSNQSLRVSLRKLNQSKKGRKVQGEAQRMEGDIQMSSQQPSTHCWQSCSGVTVLLEERSSPGITGRLLEQIIVKLQPGTSEARVQQAVNRPGNIKDKPNNTFL